MSCTTNVCGAGLFGGDGDGGGPVTPGDPDNNITVSARQVAGGILVTWTYPTINPHAVAHTLVYRSTTNEFTGAVQAGIASGSSYNDQLSPTTDTEYFYWIRLVAVSGTIGARIGPASAIARPRGDDTLEDLTARIDEGVLATALRSEIDKISLNYAAIIQEVDNRLASNKALADALSIINARTDEVETFVVDEVTQRKNGDDALVTKFNLLAAANANNSALIVEERNARVTADSAFSQIQTTLNSQVNHPVTGLPATRATLINDYYTKSGTNEAIAAANLTLNSVVFNPSTGLAATRSLLINDYYTKSGTNSAISSATLGLVSQTGLNNALGAYTSTAALQNAYYTKADTNSAIASATLNLATKTQLANYTTTADLQINYYTKTAANSAISQAITTIQVTGPQGGTVALQQAMTAQYGLNNQYSALYTMKLSNNGLIGGFGLYNDGITVEAGFDVDRFWLGRTNYDKVKPFVMDNGVVYINEARIKNAYIDTLMIAGGAITAMRSSEGSSGTVSPGGNVQAVSTGISLPSGASGVIIIPSVQMIGAGSGTSIVMYVQRHDGKLLAGRAVSVQDGFYGSYTSAYFDDYPVYGYNGYYLVLTNPTSGPGSNKTTNYSAPTITVMGGKR